MITSLKKFIQEKLIINTDSKINKDNKQINIDDVILYLNRICFEKSIIVAINQDQFYDQHWNSDEQKQHQEDIPDIGPDNYFITTCLKLINRFQVSSILNGKLENNGLIDIKVLANKISKKSDYAPICLVFDGRLNKDLKNKS